MLGKRFVHVQIGAMLFLLALALSPADAAENAKANRLRIIDLKGTAYERGHQHGKMLRREIHELLGLWKADLKKNFQSDPDAFVRSFLKNTNYRPAIERWTPDLIKEIKGIAEGSGVDFTTIFVFQLVDEYWVRGKVDGEHCSSVGVMPPKGRSPLVAQNLDLESFRDGFQTLLRIEDSNGLKTFVVTFPGFIGACGVNSRGVAVVPNTLDQLKNSNDGLPVACVIRGILSQTNLIGATDFVRRIRHASGQNYLMGDAGGIVDFECSASKVAQYGEGQDVLWHTNHALQNDDYTTGWAATLKQNPDVLRNSSSTVRYENLQLRLAGFSGVISIEDLKGVLRSKDSARFPVCRPNKGQGAFTFASVLMVLGPTPALHIASGPPDQNEYQVLRLD
jgi:isopenicillin-N N-acyltransferase like protein